MEMIASEMMRPAFWLTALQIMGINILLSGDNAVVIALAVRGLPPKDVFFVDPVMPDGEVVRINMKVKG